MLTSTFDTDLLLDSIQITPTWKLTVNRYSYHLFTRLVIPKLASSYLLLVDVQADLLLVDFDLIANLLLVKDTDENEEL